MEHIMTFDTLQYVKKAREAGFTEKQAEFQAEELAKIIDEHTAQAATKHDLHNLKHELKHDLKHEIQMAENRLQVALIDLELRLLTKVGYMMSASVAILGVLIAFLHR